MQTVLITNQYPDLYRFLAAMAEISYSYEDANTPEYVTNTVVIWSSESHSELLDSRDKVDLVEHYAEKMNVEIILSAAADPKLRALGRQAGWKVLWDIPGLDFSVAATMQNYSADQAWGSRENQESYDPGYQAAC